MSHMVTLPWLRLLVPGEECHSAKAVVNSAGIAHCMAKAIVGFGGTPLREVQMLCAMMSIHLIGKGR